MFFGNRNLNCNWGTVIEEIIGHLSLMPKKCQPIEITCNP